jgi:hypothetical protein
MVVELVPRRCRIFFTDCAKLSVEVVSDGKKSSIDVMQIGQVVWKLN